MLIYFHVSPISIIVVIAPNWLRKCRRTKPKFSYFSRKLFFSSSMFRCLKCQIDFYVFSSHLYMSMCMWLFSFVVSPAHSDNLCALKLWPKLINVCWVNFRFRCDTVIVTKCRNQISRTKENLSNVLFKWFTLAAESHRFQH